MRIAFSRLKLSELIPPFIELLVIARPRHLFETTSMWRFGLCLRCYGVVSSMTQRNNLKHGQKNGQHQSKNFCKLH